MNETKLRAARVVKKVNIAQLKRDHKKTLEQMEARRNALGVENAALKSRIVEVQRACQALVDKWALERFEYERAITKARDEIQKLYTIRNAS